MLPFSRSNKRALKAIKMKGWIVISYLQLSYTSEMEKAMQSAHGVGYEQYRRDHDVRMKVEQRREEDYQQSMRLLADLNRKTNHSF